MNFMSVVGGGDSIKRISVAIEAQIRNVEITKVHVSVLNELFGFLSKRFHINQSVVDGCLDIIREGGLDILRGTISEPQVIRTYHLIEAKNE